MTGTDWTQVLIGHQSPKGLPIVGTAAASRGATAAANHNFADLLTQQQSTSLLNQEGITAQDIREAFAEGAKRHRRIAETNDTIASAYQASHDSGTELQRELNNIAREGNHRIGQIQSSGDPLPIKVGKITEVVMDCQNRANVKAATHCGNVFDQIQTVLDKRGVPLSARQFAQNQGTDVSRSFGSPNRDSVRTQVEKTVKTAGGSNTQPLGNFRQGGGPGLSNENPSTTNLGLNQSQVPLNGGPAPSPQAPAVRDAGFNGVQMPNNPPPVGPVLRDAGFNITQMPRDGGLTVAPPSTPGSPSIPSTGVRSLPTSGLTSGPFPSAPPMAAMGGGPPLSPTNLAQSFDHGFDHGLQMGTPMGATANAVPPTGPVAPQLPPPVPQVAPTSPPFPSTAQTPIFGTAHAVDIAPAPPAHIGTDATPAYVAAPAAAPQVPAAPVGPLPAYGADIRPPIAVIPPAPPASPTAPAGPLAAVPSSGPVNPSAGVGQPAVVRQSSAQPAQPPTPAGIGEQTVVATAGGSAVGAASAAATARARLQRLVDSVARQAPHLRWAAGDRSDGTTVLVTDLASGWIPPGINLPVGVELLEPAQRRSDLETLLGEVTAAASYTPIHYLSTEEVKDPVPTSPRARRGPVVDELGWELGQATKFRDGLPRLAHTLARAASAGTGILDNEIDVLRHALDQAQNQVLESYPDNVQPAAVGNWQLLATIDALSSNDHTGANYHFAWFKALSQPTSTGAI